MKDAVREAAARRLLLQDEPQDEPRPSPEPSRTVLAAPSPRTPEELFNPPLHPSPPAQSSGHNLCPQPKTPPVEPIRKSSSMLLATESESETVRKRPASAIKRPSGQSDPEVQYERKDAAIWDTPESEKQPLVAKRPASNFRQADEVEAADSAAETVEEEQEGAEIKKRPSALRNPLMKRDYGDDMTSWPWVPVPEDCEENHEREIVFGDWKAGGLGSSSFMAPGPGVRATVRQLER